MISWMTAMTSAPASGPARLESGKALAQAYCAACHLFPEPDLLDRKTWAEQTLWRMKVRMGLAPEDLKRYPDFERIKASGSVLSAPLCTPDEFRQIADYYLASAPLNALPQAQRPAIESGVPGFRFEPGSFRIPPPATTLVHISRASKRIYAAHAETKTLHVLDASGQEVDAIAVGNVPVALTETSRGLYVTMIGQFLPSEEALGEMTLLERQGERFRPSRVFFQHAPRFTHSEFADLNGDGRMDLAACYFGYFTGRFVWHESLGGGEYREHVLYPKPGAVRSVARDFNGDGRRDLAVLIAQETEAMFLFLNNGQGQFTHQAVFQHSPCHGHTYFEVADFNRDGLDDFLVTNGDNGEYPSPTKRYHGVRIYLNRGNLRFEESWFFPMNGAFKAVARDFDGDGDLDIAAISFFPDYRHSPEESFVLLQNQGGMRFRAFSFPEAVSGRWLTMDAEDLDGDGDIDLALGSYIRGPSEVPEQVATKWEAEGRSVVLLRNSHRNASVDARTP